ncbi:transcriptional regulator, partial [Subtercola boreus]
NNHTAAQRWWRNLADELTPEQAQQSLTKFATGQDGRKREGRDGTTTAAAMFAAERLAPLPPTLFPVVVTEERIATRQAVIDWRGNRYSVPPELAATRVVVHQRLGVNTIDIATISGVVLARHQVAEPGLGVTIRDSGHVTALEAIALASAPPGRPHRKKERIPPGGDARAAAAALAGTPTPTTTVIDLAAYEQAAKNRNTLT